MRRGFTLVEILASLAIVGIIAAISVSSFLNFNRKEALELETGKMLSLLAEARALTLSGKDGAVFGVHFETGKAVLFKGATYSAGSAGNRELRIHDEVRLSAITLAGGATDVVFKKLTGATAQSGTLTLVSNRDATDTRTITITATGVAYSD